MDKLDLVTLKHIKFMFDIHSDFSTKCNGYKSLLRIIDDVELEKKIIERNEKLKKIDE